MRMSVLSGLEITFFFGTREKTQPFGLFEPIGLEFGEAGPRGTGACDGDEKPSEVGKPGGVGLNQSAEMAAKQDTVVSLAAAAGGNKAGFQGIQRGICERAQNDETASFCLADGLDAREVRAAADTAFPWEAHDGAAWCIQGGAWTDAQECCCV